LAEREIDEAVHRHDDRRLRAVERALQKIKDGTYGLSELSGTPIPTARLQAIPEALLTVEEEARAEKRKRRTPRTELSCIMGLERNQTSVREDWVEEDSRRAACIEVQLHRSEKRQRQCSTPVATGKSCRCS